jgi:uncharacterized protein (UPF0332 family)
LKPETARFLAKARHCLDNGRVNLKSLLGDDAGRNSYLAAFHAAQAFIFERTGKVTKTHKGVHTQFDQLSSRESEVDTGFRQFLARAYNLKSIADYETGPGAEIPPERAAAAMETAQQFVDCIERVLGKVE